MNSFARFLIFAGLVLSLAATASVYAEEPENFNSDAAQGTGEPPTVPHKIPDGATSDSCLGCHKTGTNGAMETSHPERLDCTQCHVQGEVNAPAIPHKVRGAIAAKTCNPCHLKGIKVAPKTKHPDRTQCGQCHERAK